MIAALFRLAFISACSAYVLGLVLLADWRGVAVSFLTGLVGVVLAIVLAQDFSEQPREAQLTWPTHRARRQTHAYDGEG